MLITSQLPVSSKRKLFSISKPLQFEGSKITFTMNSFAVKRNVIHTRAG